MSPRRESFPKLLMLAGVVALALNAGVFAVVVKSYAAQKEASDQALFNQETFYLEKGEVMVSQERNLEGIGEDVESLAKRVEEMGNQESESVETIIRLEASVEAKIDALERREEELWQEIETLELQVGKVNQRLAKLEKD